LKQHFGRNIGLKMPTVGPVLLPILSAQNRYLLLQMVKREIAAKYKNSALGLFWAVLLPLVMLAVYSFVFQGVFKARWPGQEIDADFALNVFAGLILFTFFSDAVGRAPGLISEQPNLVKKVVFPIELLAAVNVLNTLFYASISILVLVMGVLVFKQQLGLQIFMLFPLMVIFAVLLLGLTLLLSAVGVYFQDLKHIVGMVITPLLFLSPVFYPVKAVPDSVQLVMYLNPLTIMIEQVREVVIGAGRVDFALLGVYSIVSVVVFLVGFTLFKSLKRGFSDVL
jgi:lipopolysaccharide transport system permease protein